MATIPGDNAPNLLEGSSFEDSLSGGGGNDTLQGYGGDDTLRGDDGDDELWGGAGNDSLYGGNGNDILRADGDPAGAFNRLEGGAGNDQLRGSAGNDTLIGGAGDDMLDAGGGTDLLQGGDGNDQLSIAQAGHYTLEGGAGSDTFSTLGLGSTSVVGMKGGSGTDTFIATYDPPAAGGSSSLIRCLDFSAGSGGDVIDLGAVLPLVTGLVGIDDPFDKRLGHIRLVQQGADTALQFDPDGKAGNDSAWHTLLLLKGVSASAMTLGNLSGTRGDSTLDVVQGTSTAPKVAAPIPELLAKPGASISYKLPSGTFSDADVGDVMQIGVTMAEGRALPGWLAYDAQTQTFTGKLPTGTPQVPVVIVVTATDAAGLSVNDRFAITPATAQGDSLRGAAGNDEYDGLAGDDTIDGAAGNDIIEGNVGNDRLLGDAGNDKLSGGDGSDSLYGGDGNDSLAGGANSDSLDGGAGNDTLAGGAGDDRYVVDSSGDRVVEAAGGGSYDVVSTLVQNYTLPAEVETLWLGGSSHLSGTGNKLSNTLVGNGGNNRINGADGDDTLNGGAGNDTLSGGNGNDRLDGGAGNDSMVGGAGNDSYHVLSSGDKVVEASGGGTDTVLSALPAYTLGAEIENGRINTSAASNLNGNALNNVLWAGAGNNVLSGGAGIDTADYGASFSAVNLHLGITTAQATGGSGSDTLLGIENLSGSAYNDRLTGNGGANVLNGGSGNDTMEGGAGNDLYVVDTVADMLFERGDGGVDSVSSSVSYTLPTSVEKLTLTGSGTINGNGNGASNTITGNGMANVLAGIDGNDALRGMAGNDSLNGGNGNDLLDGGAGNDTLNGSAGLDTFRFSSALSGSSNVDRIAGFIGADDTLQLENSVFMKLTTTGVLSASFFRASTSGNAVDSNDFVLYDTDSGQLYYDADGIGTGAKVLVATLTATPSGMPVLTSADIFVT